jgi:acyl dehydratase
MTDEHTLTVGRTHTASTFKPISRTDIVRYSGASGDFNPIHHDDAAAARLGFPTVISIGMYQAGLLATYATDWLGAENIRRFTARFKDQVWPGDELTCRGSVTAIDPDGDGFRVAVALECSRQTGDVAIEGAAQFVLRSLSIPGCR